MIFSESNVHPEVRDDDFKRFLRFPPARAFEGPLAENAEWVRHWYARRGRPWCCAREVGIEVVPDAGLRLNGQLYGSPLVAGRFCDATSAIVVAASAGVEADEEAAARWAVDEPDRYFFVECYAAAVVEALLLKAGRRLAAWSQPRLLSRHYCPGYPGWPVTDTPAFLELVRGNDPLPGPLDTLSSGMLRPKNPSSLSLACHTR